MNNIQMSLVSESERHVYCLLLEFMHIGRKQSWIPDSRAAWGAVYDSLSGVMCWILNFICVLQLHNLFLEHCFMCGHFAKALWQRWFNIIKKIFLLSTKYTKIWFLRRIHMQESAVLLHSGCFVVVVVFMFLFPWFIWYETSNFCLLLHSLKSFFFCHIPWWQ